MRYLVVLAVFILTALVLVACGRDPAPAAPPLNFEPAPTATPAPTASPAPTATPALAATPVPMATPAPTATPVPTVTPAPTATLAPTPAWNWPPAYAFLVDFLARHSPRESGTDEETATGDYLAEQMEGLGYEVSFEEFDFIFDESATLDIDGEALEVHMMENSAPGAQIGPLVYVGLGQEQDIPEEGLYGKIALIKRGELLFQDKGANAAAAGAVAAIVFNNEPELFGGYVQGLDIPVLSLSGEDGEALLARLEAGEELSAELTAEVEIRTSRNVVTYMAGAGDSGRTLILGAHYDTLPDTEGANDNAAGVSVLRMVAEHIGGMDLPFNIKILFFGAGEAGLVGADEYAEGMSEEERENALGMVNFDVLGTGLGLELVGDPELTELADSAGRDLGIGYAVKSLEEDGGWSNHTEFSEVGVPVVWFTADNAQQTYSGGVDDLKWINPAFLDQVERTAVEFVRRLAEE